MMEVKNVPAEAFKLKASAIEFNAVEGGEADTYEISMLARSAGAIEHWYWGEQVVHDMAGMNVAGKIPIDFNHEAEVIGYLDKFEETEDGLRVTGKLVSFQPDDRAAEIAFKARQGVPWQASINFGGDGIKVEQVAEGETTQANGREFSGPATVIRSWPLRGVAVTPYGADQHTQSTVLSDDGEQAVTFFNQEGQAMADEQATVEAEEQAEEAAVETCGECGSELDNDNNAESNDDAEQVEATAETSDELDDEPESDDEAVEEEAETKAEPQAAALDAKAGKRLIELFGSQGAVWFIEGKTEQECFQISHDQLAEQVMKLNDENEKLRASAEALDHGEDSPLDFCQDAPASDLSNRVNSFKKQNLSETAAFFAAKFDNLDK